MKYLDIVVLCLSVTAVSADFLGDYDYQTYEPVSQQRRQPGNRFTHPGFPFSDIFGTFLQDEDDFGSADRPQKEVPRDDPIFMTALSGDPTYEDDPTSLFDFFNGEDDMIPSLDHLVPYPAAFDLPFLQRDDDLDLFGGHDGQEGQTETGFGGQENAKDFDLFFKKFFGNSFRDFVNHSLNNHTTTLHHNLPPNYSNSTSKTHHTDGSKVVVNETIHKNSGDNFNHFYHVKVVHVSPHHNQSWEGSDAEPEVTMTTETPGKKEEIPIGSEIDTPLYNDSNVDSNIDSNFDSSIDSYDNTVPIGSEVETSPEGDSNIDSHVTSHDDSYHSSVPIGSEVEASPGDSHVESHVDSHVDSYDNSVPIGSEVETSPEGDSNIDTTIASNIDSHVDANIDSNANSIPIGSEVETSVYDSSHYEPFGLTPMQEYTKSKHPKSHVKRLARTSRSLSTAEEIEFPDAGVNRFPQSMANNERIAEEHKKMMNGDDSLSRSRSYVYKDMGGKPYLYIVNHNENDREDIDTNRIDTGVHGYGTGVHRTEDSDAQTVGPIRPPDLSRDTRVNPDGRSTRHQGMTLIDPEAEVFNLTLVIREIESRPKN